MTVPQTTTGTSVDLMCGYCGRPIIGEVAWGALPYHPACVQPPPTDSERHRCYDWYPTGGIDPKNTP